MGGGEQSANVVSKAVNKCRKEHQSLESKCELARGKIDLEQGQNQRYGTIRCHHWQGCILCVLDLCMDQAIFYQCSIFYLRVSIWVDLLDLGVIGRELMRKVGMSIL